jgi:ABC-type Mn2+/Zn2+ transport system permease subunit
MLLPAAFARHDANDVGDTEREAGICALVAASWGPVAAVMLDLPVGAGVVAALVVVGATSRAVRVRNFR